MKRATYWFMVALGFSAMISLAAVPFTQETSAAENDNPSPSATVVDVTPDPTLNPFPSIDPCLDPETANVDCFPNATPAPDTCWDCLGNTLTDEETLLLVCSPDSLAENPQHREICYPDELFWSCDPDGWCESDGEDDPTGEGYDW